MVSNLAGPVEADHMIPLGPDDDVQVGDIYNDGFWTRPEPQEVEPEPDLRAELEQLKAANAELQATNLTLMQSVFDIYSMVAALQPTEGAE